MIQARHLSAWQLMDQRQKKECSCSSSNNPIFGWRTAFLFGSCEMHIDIGSMQHWLIEDDSSGRMICLSIAFSFIVCFGNLPTKMKCQTNKRLFFFFIIFFFPHHFKWMKISRNNSPFVNDMMTSSLRRADIRWSLEDRRQSFSLGRLSRALSWRWMRLFACKQRIQISTKILDFNVSLIRLFEEAVFEGEIDEFEKNCNKLLLLHLLYFWRVNCNRMACAWVMNAV